MFRHEDTDEKIVCHLKMNISTQATITHTLRLSHVEYYIRIQSATPLLHCSKLSVLLGICAVCLVVDQ